MKGGRKPALLEGRINYEVMGADEWRHAASLGQMGPDRISYYFGTQTSTGLQLSEQHKEKATRAVVETLNLADRSTLNSQHY